jgi:hypothetical protein
MRATTLPPGNGGASLHPLPWSPATAHAGRERRVVWTLQLHEPQRMPWGLLHFLNGGRGEQALRWGGPFAYQASPAGPGSEAGAAPGGWCRPLPGALDYFRGLESAEEWVGTELDHRVRYRSHPGNALEIWGPGSEVITSMSTGRRVLMRFESRLWVFPDGTLSERSENAVTGWREL